MVEVQIEETITILPRASESEKLPSKTGTENENQQIENTRTSESEQIVSETCTGNGNQQIENTRTSESEQIVSETGTENENQQTENTRALETEIIASETGTESENQTKNKDKPTIWTNINLEHTNILGQILATLPPVHRYWALQNLEEIEKSWKGRIKPSGPTIPSLTTALRLIEFESSSQLEDLEMTPEEKYKNFVMRYGNTVYTFCACVKEYHRPEVYRKIRNVVYIWTLNTKAKGEKLHPIMGDPYCFA